MKEILPFLAAAAIYLASPLLARRIVSSVARWIEEGRQYARVPESEIPDYLAVKQVYDYIAFAADLSQVFPAVLLTSVGIILAIPDDFSPTGTAVLVLLTAMAAIVTEAYVSGMSPQRYASRKYFSHFSLVSVVGIFINVSACVLVLVLR